MQYYPTLQPEKDFHFIEAATNLKGTRKKRSVIVTPQSGNPAIGFFKYQAYNTSELCSEKMAHELACVLKYPCARIELAVDENGAPGIISFLFTTDQTPHTDAVDILKNTPQEKRRTFYSYDRVRTKLDRLDTKLFPELIPILFFDALVGEVDRHEENWGISATSHFTSANRNAQPEYHISPIYDTGACLLREFVDEKFAIKYYTGVKSFSSYINRAQAVLYDENGKRFNHFKLMEFLNDEFHDIIKLNIDNLKRELSDEVINNIVDRIPEEMLTTQHRDFIKKYVKERRNILIGMEK